MSVSRLFLFSLHSPSRTKTTITTLCISQIINRCYINSDIRHNYKLRDAFFRFDSHKFISIIVECNNYLAPVVTINHAYAICGTQSTFCSKTRSCEYSTKIVFWNFYCNTSPYFYGRVWCNIYRARCCCI